MLDRYLEALRAPGAQAMTFRSGAPVELQVSGAARALGEAAPSVEELRAILGEVLPAEYRFEADGVARDFPYDAPIGRVRITVRIADAGIVARLMPWGSSVAPAQAEKMVIDPTRASAVPPPMPARASSGRTKAHAKVKTETADARPDTRPETPALHRLVGSVVTVHLAGASAVIGTILALDDAPQGWTVVLEDRDGKLSIVPYGAIARIEVG